MKNGKSSSRREFLKTSTAALAGMALTTGSGCSPEQGQVRGNRKIVYRQLGRTGIRLPVVSMGSAYAVNLVKAALAVGLVYIHTSSGY